MGLLRRSLLLLLAAASISPVAAQQSGAPAKLPVIASFSILADLVRAVGGDRVDVVSVIGPDTDAHGFEPTPADAGRVARAKLIVVNGLGFDEWMPRLAKGAASRAPVVVASRGIRTMAEPAGHAHGHDLAHGSDPHAFGNVANTKIYVAAIRDALVAADPEGRATFEANAVRYSSELDALDREMVAALAPIPPERRRVITDHDAFRYFGAAYGLTFVAPRTVSRAGDVSARDVARIVRQIKADRIPAVFLENVADSRLLEQIAREGGAKVGGRLYSDALSAPGGPAATYLDLMRHNARTLAAALVP
jgi:zinc/manganese transport system substrate-binding protein